MYCEVLCRKICSSSNPQCKRYIARNVKYSYCPSLDEALQIAGGFFPLFSLQQKKRMFFRCLFLAKQNLFWMTLHSDLFQGNIMYMYLPYWSAKWSA